MPSHEDSECIKNLLKSVHNGTGKLTRKLRKPGVVLGDGAMAITSAVHNFGVDCPKAMCWDEVYHVRHRIS